MQTKIDVSSCFCFVLFFVSFSLVVAVKGYRIILQHSKFTGFSHDVKFVKKNSQRQVLSGDFQHARGKMHVQLSPKKSIFLSLRFYNFIKGIVRIYIIFFKKFRLLFLYVITCSIIFNY